MYHILIVDDEAPMRDSINKRYSRLGHRVTEAANGVEGLARFKEARGSINLIITDVMMPEMNGVELIAKIRALDPIVPILGITAHEDFKDQLSILGSGAYFYLAKPLPRWDVVDRLIENAFKQYKSEKSERESSNLVRGYIRTHSENAMAGTPVELTIEQIDTPKPSGDFAEAMFLPKGKVLFYLADVRGHAELTPCLMACLSSIILHRSQYEKDDLDLALLASRVDQGLRKLLATVGLEDFYLTLFLGCLDIREQKLSYVNAAHPAPLLFRAGSCERAEPLESTGRPVGMKWLEIKNPAHDLERAIDFRPGDMLFLYSDGASDLLGHEGGAGIALLKTLAEGLVPCSPRAIVEKVRDHLFEVAGGIEGFPDDTTLMAIRLKSEAPEPSA